MSCWQTRRLWFREAILEVEYTHHPGEDWGGFGWRVPPRIELNKVTVVEGELESPYDDSELEQHIYDEFHR